MSFNRIRERVVFEFKGSTVSVERPLEYSAGVVSGVYPVLTTDGNVGLWIEAGREATQLADERGELLQYSEKLTPLKSWQAGLFLERVLASPRNRPKPVVASEVLECVWLAVDGRMNSRSAAQFVSATGVELPVINGYLADTANHYPSADMVIDQIAPGLDCGAVAELRRELRLALEDGEVDCSPADMERLVDFVGMPVMTAV